jgi:hypothetical protein
MIALTGSLGRTTDGCPGSIVCGEICLICHHQGFG